MLIILITSITLLSKIVYPPDDSVRLQSLITSNRIISLGDSTKTYHIYQTLYIPDNTTIIGNGAKIIQHTPHIPIIDCKNRKNIKFSGLKLIGVGNDYKPSSSSLSVGIYCWGTKNMKIESCEFYNFSNTPIAGLRNTKNILLENNFFAGTGLNNPKFYQKDHTGITLGGKNISIINNKISKSSQGIIIAEDSDSVTISNNKIFDIPLEHGIYIDTSCSNIEIFNNAISNVGGSGIKLQNRNFPKSTAENINIINNVISNTKIGDGILLYNSETNSLYFKNVNICDNRVSNIGQHGINIRNTMNTNVNGNIVENCKYAGLYLKENYILNVNKNSFNNLGENGVFDEGSGENIIIDDNKFLNVGIAGNDKNGKSSGIFMENGTKRTLKKNSIVGSKNMQHAIYIADGKYETMSIVDNIFSKVKEEPIRLRNNKSRIMKNYNNRNY